MERLHLTLGFLGLTAVSTLALADPPLFIVTKLANPGDTRLQVGASLSSSGQVAGHQSPWLWTSGFGLMSVGEAQYHKDYVVTGLNSGGSIVALRDVTVPMIWNAAIGRVTLPVPNMRPAAINDFGAIAASIALNPPNGPSLLLDVDGTQHQLSTGKPVAMNDSGLVLGLTGTTPNLVNVAGTFVELRPAGLAPSIPIQPIGINNNGQALISVQNGTPANYLYQPSDHQLHLIPGMAGASSTIPTGLNNVGWIVGDSCSDQSCTVREPFLRYDGNYYKLGSLILPTGYHPSGNLTAVAVNDAGQILVNSTTEGALLFSSEGPPMANQITSPMGGEVTLVAGQKVHATASGEDVVWTADRISDGAPEFATGSGKEFTFTVPADSTRQQRIVLTAMSSEGTATVTYPIAAAAGAHITEPAASLSVRAGETVTLRGTGGHVHWAVSLFPVGSPVFAQGDGDEFSFTVPGDLTSMQILRVTLTSDAGTDARAVSIDPLKVETYLPLASETLPQVRAMPGSRTYSDRDYVVHYLSPALAGGVAIQTRNDDKYSTAYNVTALTFSTPADVYIVCDSRIQGVPAWMSDWALTSETYDSDALIHPRVYHRQVGAGEFVTFSGNLVPPASPIANALVSNYVIIAKPR
jgi:hypothetical protein